MRVNLRLFVGHGNMKQTRVSDTAVVPISDKSSVPFYEYPAVLTQLQEGCLPLSPAALIPCMQIALQKEKYMNFTHSPSCFNDVQIPTRAEPLLYKTPAQSDLYTHGSYTPEQI